MITMIKNLPAGKYPKDAITRGAFAVSGGEIYWSASKVLYEKIRQSVDEGTSDDRFYLDRWELMATTDNGTRMFLHKSRVKPGDRIEVYVRGREALLYAARKIVFALRSTDESRIIAAMMAFEHHYFRSLKTGHGS